MSRNDFSRLFDHLGELTVGFGPFFRDFELQSTKYPHHNIVQLSDSEILIELAVAGFKKSEIKLEMHQGILTIKGEKATSPEHQYQYQGIAARAFTKTFRIAEYYEVSDASLEDGVLSVKFIKNVPEAAKPKTIEIK